MPELAEVEFFRKQWDPGLRQAVQAVVLHPKTRIFRGTDANALRERLRGVVLKRSEANGKQLLFGFSHGCWLGIHLGMSGKLKLAPRNFSPNKHDHLVLVQRKQSLVFEDSRQFGRVRFSQSDEPPDWWQRLPPSILSPAFDVRRVAGFLKRHGRLAIKGTLLLQDGFPGVGNWMADEILWQARLHPKTPCARFSDAQCRALRNTTRRVCRVAVERIGHDFSDPPRDWLFHERWQAGHCPRDGEPLIRETVAGRTTAWCPRCQVK